MNASVLIAPARRVWLCLLAALLLVLAMPARAGDDPALAITGRWVTEPRDGLIEIARLPDGSFEGKIIGGSHPGRTDTHNPDPSKRALPLRGTVILRAMHYNQGEWSGGMIYDPNSGNDYRCKLEVLDGEHLKVRGYIGISLLGRTQVWTRYHGTSLELPATTP